MHVMVVLCKWKQSLMRADLCNLLVSVAVQLYGEHTQQLQTLQVISYNCPQFSLSMHFNNGSNRSSALYENVQFIHFFAPFFTIN